MLFRFLSRLFVRRRPTRAIFQFWDGQRDRRVDPLEIYRAINSDKECNVETESALMTSDDPETSGPATERVVACVRRVFGLKHFNDGGLLETECLELVEEFYDFLGALKKNTSEPPHSSPSTDIQSSTISTDPPPATGNSSSDSTKTPSDPS